MLTKRIGGELRLKLQNSNDKLEGSHLVLFCDKEGSPKPTLKFYRAILSGLYIISYTCNLFIHLQRWFYIINLYIMKGILESFKEQRWVDEKPHLVKSPGATIGREVSLKNVQLFSGYSFYLYSENTYPSNADLENLIRLGNGKILSSLPSLPTTPEEVCFLLLFTTLRNLYYKKISLLILSAGIDV